MYEFTCRSEVFSFAWRYSYDIDRISRIFMQHRYRSHNVGESLRAINVNYLVSDSINSGVFQSSPRRDALTRKLLLTYFADIRSSPLLLLAQSNCRIPGNLKGKIHRTSFEEGGIKVSDFRNARDRRLHITRISNENEVLRKCPRQFLFRQSFFTEYPCQNTRETSFLSRGTFGRHDDNV